MLVPTFLETELRFKALRAKEVNAKDNLDWKNTCSVSVNLQRITHLSVLSWRNVW